jgi:hypothetical protein
MPGAGRLIQASLIRKKSVVLAKLIIFKAVIDGLLPHP